MCAILFLPQINALDKKIKKLEDAAGREMVARGE